MLLSKDLSAVLQARGFRGDVASDLAARSAFSTDNSVYQIIPDIVVAPRDAEDVALLLEVLDLKQFSHLAITARGGGTGTNGQALNAGVIIDFRRYMNHILALNVEEGWVDVEPGIVLDALNEQLAPTGLFFAPTTSTANRCTIGGMASTDASGKGSRIYGKTADNVLGLDIVLAGGATLKAFEPTPSWAEPLLDAVAKACDRGRDALLAQVPALSRRFSGLDLERARPDSGTLDWWRLFIGAEGTLGQITRLRLKLTPKPMATRLGVIAFSSFSHVLAATTALLPFEPLAIEVIDEWVQRLAQQAGLFASLPEAIKGQDGINPVYAFVEFAGDDGDALDRQLAQCIAHAAGLEGYAGAHAAADPAQIAQLWSVRAASVGLLGATEGRRRPVSFVEDCVVPPENLAAFVTDFVGILDQHGVACGMYGHADVGCLHVRPALDIDDEGDRQRYGEISDAVFAAATRHGGIFWGEHGKGIRGDYLEQFVGPVAFAAFQKIKAAFDPAGRFNPGKLAVGKSQRYSVAKTPFRVAHTAQGDPMEKAYACNGNAACLTYAAKVPMCPSFKVSADLRHSPKGRAEAVRALETARQAGNVTPAMEDDVFAVMDGCLGCKSCAGSCPTHVDIPEMRSHFLEGYYTDRRRPLADHMALALERFSPLLRRLRPLMRLTAATPLYQWGGRMLGMVDLPRPDSAHGLRGLSEMTPDQIKELSDAKMVVLVQDPFTSLFDTDAIADIARGLRVLGYRPVLLSLMPAGKAAHVKGARSAFAQMTQRFSAHLQRAAHSGLPLVGIDPNLVYMLRSEYPKSGVSGVPNVLSIEEFLGQEIANGSLSKRSSASSRSITLFTHCTEKSLQPGVPGTWAKVMAHLGIKNEMPATGCCGMSGLFGHEHRHQAWSAKLFDMSWRKPVAAAETVAATGFSCRCQVERLSGKTARHPLGLIAEALES